MKRETTLVICVVLTLVCIGVLMVYSATAVSMKDVVAEKGVRHLQFVLVGLAAMAIATRFDYHRLRDLPILSLILLVVFAGLIIVLIPGLGEAKKGGQRWIQITSSIGYQPAEVAKFGLVLVLAVYMTWRREKAGAFFQGFLIPLVLAGGMAGLVVAERDLGIPVVMALTTGVMLYIGGAQLRYLGLGALLGGAAVGALINYFPHRLERLGAFLDPWAYRDSAGFQLIQSLSAFAQGGLIGRGAGAGEQKLGYLPEIHTDFIFSLIGEEFGLIGTLTILILYGLLLFAIFRIAMNAPDLFGSLLATGIGALIGIQAVLIMCVTTGLLPTKGLPLPFISAGGTAMLMYLGMSGVIVNIGAQVQKAIPQKRLVPSIHTA